MLSDPIVCDRCRCAMPRTESAFPRRCPRCGVQWLFGLVPTSWALTWADHALLRSYGIAPSDVEERTDDAAE